MRTLIVTGTGTDVGKTVVIAAIAALARAAGERVTVVKPAQTGVGPGRARGPRRGRAPRRARRHPRARPLPRAARPGHRRPAGRRDAGDGGAGRRRGAGSSTPTSCSSRARAGSWCASTTTCPPAQTLADVAAGLDAPVLLVASAGLGVLNTAALTAEALARRGIPLLGVVVGAYPGRARPRRADQPRRPPARSRAHRCSASCPRVWAGVDRGRVPRRGAVWPRSRPRWWVVPVRPRREAHCAPRSPHPPTKGALRDGRGDRCDR